jgi:hypothetical protein
MFNRIQVQDHVKQLTSGFKITVLASIAQLSTAYNVYGQFSDNKGTSGSFTLFLLMGVLAFKTYFLFASSIFQVWSIANSLKINFWSINLRKSSQSVRQTLRSTFFSASWLTGDLCLDFVLIFMMAKL